MIYTLQMCFHTFLCLLQKINSLCLQKMLWIGNNIWLNVDSILCIWNDNLTLTLILQKTHHTIFLWPGILENIDIWLLLVKKISCVLDRCIKVKKLSVFSENVTRLFWLHKYISKEIRKELFGVHVRGISRY